MSKNKTGITRVVSFRIRKGSKLDQWWNEVDNPSSVTREIMTAYVMTHYEPERKQAKAKKQD